MRLIGIVLAAALAVIAAPAGAASIDFRHIAAQVTIVPQDRADVSVVFLKTSPAEPLRVYHWGDTTVVAKADWTWTGWFLNPGMDCAREHGGPVDAGDLPRIVVFTPMDAEVMASGAVLGVVGHADSLKLSSAGCGQWTIANIKNALVVEAAGWNAVRGGHAGSMKIDIAGAGDVREQAATNGLEVSIAGSGEVRVGQASGPVSLHIAGGGDIDVAGGHATTLDAHIAGSGEMKYGGVADSLDAGIVGSGHIAAAKVTGAVKRDIAGSGAIDVGP